MRKGDMSTTVLIGMMIAVVSFLVIMAVLSKSFSAIPDKNIESSCRFTNVARGNSKLDIDTPVGNFEQSVVPQACRTVDRRLQGTEDQIMLQIADLASSCWWQWANGRFRGLLCDKKGNYLYGTCGESKCFQCYSFSFKEIKQSRTQSFDATRLRNFMRARTKLYEDEEKEGEEPVKDAIPVSYLDYIQYDQRGLIIFHNLKENPPMQFKPNTVYGIYYFEPHEGSDIWDDMTDGFGMFGGDSNEQKLDVTAILIDESAEVSSCGIKYLEGAR